MPQLPRGPAASVGEDRRGGSVKVRRRTQGKREAGEWRERGRWQRPGLPCGHGRALAIKAAASRRWRARRAHSQLRLLL